MQTACADASGLFTPVGRLGDSDDEHLSYAVENDWLLVTFDDEFLSLVEQEDRDHAGIVYVQQAGRDIGTS